MRRSGLAAAPNPGGAAKRIFDAVVAATGLVVLAPVLVGIGLVIKLSDGGLVFYRSLRVGQGGRLFHLYKFRTMVEDADRQGPGITTASDQRVTRVGAFLRRYKLDEVPQLWNVLRGDMSLVGPRPEDPRYVTRYTPEQRAVLAVRPGMTSPASLAYHDEENLLTGKDWETTYCEEVLPAKLALELNYLRRRSFSSDLKLIFRTLATLVRQ
jgi:lipopolysaccharide/colanic/teichoic acid biosynthesis glycosyltransferase